MADRTATDILISIEEAIKDLKLRLSNTENLLKVLLNNNNNNKQQPVSSEVQSTVNIDNFESRPKTNNFEKMAAAKGINVTSAEITQAPKRIANIRGQKGVSDKKSTVSQKILKGDGSPLFIANVQIFDDAGELMAQSRTNTKGIWVAALPVGDYKVRVVKNFSQDSGSSPIDREFDITVSPSDSPMELAPINIG